MGEGSASGVSGRQGLGTARWEKLEGAARSRAQGAEAAWCVRLKPEPGAGRTARSVAIWQEFVGAQPS
jgi:hypothetical protein